MKSRTLAKPIALITGGILVGARSVGGGGQWSSDGSLSMSAPILARSNGSTGQAPVGTNPNAWRVTGKAGAVGGSLLAYVLFANVS